MDKETNQKMKESTLVDDLSLLSLNEQSIYFLFEILLAVLVMTFNTLCGVSLYKVQRRTKPTNALLFSLAIADSVNGLVSFIFHFSLAMAISKGSSFIHGLIPGLFLTNQISFLFMMLSLANRFLRTKYILNYHQVITQKKAFIALVATLVVSAVFTLASEYGFVYFKKAGRLVIAACCNIPIMVFCFTLFILSIRNLKNINSTVVSSLPSGFQTIIKISTLHFMTLTIAMLPWLVVFAVRRLGDLSEHDITLSFYWCFFSWKMYPLVNAWNILLTNKRCIRVLLPY